MTNCKANCNNIDNEYYNNNNKYNCKSKNNDKKVMIKKWKERLLSNGNNN